DLTVTGVQTCALPISHRVRERSAGTALVNIWHLWRCRAPLLPGTPASRRSTAAISVAITVLRRRTGGPYPHVIQAALAPCLSSKRVPAIQGSPLSGGGRYPSLLGRDCEPRLQAPHLAPPTRRLMRAPSIEQGMAELQGNK